MLRKKWGVNRFAKKPQNGSHTIFPQMRAFRL
jgi:hypothetical protein